MKILILCLAYISFAHSTVVPDRIVTPSLDMFSSRNKVLPNGDMKVSVTGYSKAGDFMPRESMKVIAKETFQEFLELSRAVYEVRGDGSNGTAFHIGEGLVITNLHVLKRNLKETTSCSGFGVTTWDKHSFSCKKVLFCSQPHDFCLIEMEPEASCFLCWGEEKTYSYLNNWPGLKLQNNLHPNPSVDLESVFTAIGNSGGYGVHLSQGRGIKYQGPITLTINEAENESGDQKKLRVDSLAANEYMHFYAPSTGGNSGGPLLNADGKVIGIVKHSSNVKYDNDITQAYNGAAPIGVVIPLIREALKNDSINLERFNNAVLE